MVVAEIKAEKEELHQRKEKADREWEEAETSSELNGRNLDIFYEPNFPFRYRTLYANPHYLGNFSASGSGQKYKIPWKPTTTAEEPLYTSGQSAIQAYMI